MNDSSQDWGARPNRPQQGPQPEDAPPPSQPDEDTDRELPADELPPPEEDVEVEDRGSTGRTSLPRPEGPGFFGRLQRPDMSAPGQQDPAQQEPPAAPASRPAPPPQPPTPAQQAPYRQPAQQPPAQTPRAYQQPPPPQYGQRPAAPPPTPAQQAPYRPPQPPPAPVRQAPAQPPPRRASTANRPPRRRAGCGSTLLVLIAVAALLFGTVMIGYASVARDLPPADELSERASTFASTLVYDRNGQILNEIADPNYGRRTA
ncbi:MAG: hypothetical protein MUC34_07260, partial [Anaerolineae bacterium]|nr:hypothetical protein [Anaerolineae bacterium]